MFTELLTIDELDASTRRLAASEPDRVRITRVGESWNGRPIDMISIGEGDSDVLVVGVPHPNEPAGAVTVERMIAKMLGPDGERERRGLRWHFIKAIDPEGLRLNEGWLKKPRTLRNYSANVFRPALDRQPDATFPLECSVHRFHASTPENQAWQKAFDLTRPMLHASLHHCDFGGAWHAVSRIVPELTPVLDGIIADHGLTPFSDFAVPGWPIEWASPSVMRYPSVPEILTAPINAGQPLEKIWPYGEMSPGYGEAHYGTLTLITEVPLWDDQRLRDDSASGFTARAQAREGLEYLLELEGFFERHLAELEPLVTTRDGSEMFAAIRDMVLWTANYPEHFAKLENAADSGRMLSVREYFPNGVFHKLLPLRAYSMVIRVADMVLAGNGDRRGIAAAAKKEGVALSEKVFAALDRMGAMQPVPLSTMTEVQMQSILAAADVLNRVSSARN